MPQKNTFESHKPLQKDLKIGGQIKLSKICFFYIMKMQLTVQKLKRLQTNSMFTSGSLRPGMLGKSWCSLW